MGSNLCKLKSKVNSLEGVREQGAEENILTLEGGSGGRLENTA
jgi:hypothetical protein